MTAKGNSLILLPTIAFVFACSAAAASAQEYVEPPASAVRSWETAGGGRVPCAPHTSKEALTAEEIACAIKYGVCDTINLSSCREMVKIGMSECISYVPGDEASAQRTVVECIRRYRKLKGPGWNYLLCGTLDESALRYTRYAKEECEGFSRYLGGVPRWLAAFAGIMAYCVFAAVFLFVKRRSLSRWLAVELLVSATILFVCNWFYHGLLTWCMGYSCNPQPFNDQWGLGIMLGNVAVAAIFMGGIYISMRRHRPTQESARKATPPSAVSPYHHLFTVLMAPFALVVSMLVFGFLFGSLTQIVVELVPGGYAPGNQGTENAALKIGAMGGFLGFALWLAFRIAPDRFARIARSMWRRKQ